MKPADENESSSCAGVAATAACWVQRRRAGLTEPERGELLAWLVSDPRHAEAFRAADVAEDELDWPFHAGMADVVLVGLERRARRRRMRRIAGAGVALTITLATVCVGLWWRAPVVPQANAPLVVVEPRRELLPDGTVAELAGDAEIVVAFEAGHRFVTLRRGTVHFEVSPDPQRPFVVRVGDIGVRAVGTAFAVELQRDAVQVLVTHGRVALDNEATSAQASRTEAQPAPLAFVAAGNLAIVERASGSSSPMPAVRPVSEADIEATLAWRRPRLEFSGTPLSEVVATMNRFNRVQFAIADESLSSLQLSGSLRADKVEALVQILQADFPIRAERRGEGLIQLHRR